MALIETGECRITHLNSHGCGVGSTPMGTIELACTLPGERVAFERHQYRRQSNGVLKAIIEPSPARATPPCPHFGTCGGCLLQHLNGSDYADFKAQLLHEPLQKQGIAAPIQPMQTIPPGHRRRANMEAIRKEQHVALGFHRFHSHQIINLAECSLIVPALASLIEPLKALLFPMLQPQQKVSIFMTAADNGVDMGVTIHRIATLSDTQRQQWEEFARRQGLVRLLYQGKHKPDVIYQREEPVIHFDGVPVAIDAYGFLQASSRSDSLLAALVVEGIAGAEGTVERGLDLFCGRGTYTLPLSRYARMDGFESDKRALAALEKAVQRAGRPITASYRDLFAQPLTPDELSAYAICVINPPRAGAEAQCRHLARSPIGRIAYVSCQPESFARDAALLQSGGYHLQSVTPVDQFYWSPHLEAVGIFAREVALPR